MSRFSLFAVAAQLVLFPCFHSARLLSSKNQSTDSTVVATCPYGDEATSKTGGSTSFQCHWKSEGAGNTCPELQKQRLEVSHEFFLKTYGSMVKTAKTFPLQPLFDKSEFFRGDETYEELVSLQVKGLRHPDVELVEDKIKFKKLAEKLGVPTTRTFFGAHASDWDPNAFTDTLNKLCADGVDAFMIKAVHLAWSKGQKIVRGFQKMCKINETSDAYVTELIDFINSEVLGQRASEADAHLRDYVEPGVTVEELFASGGASKVPLEVKVQCLWGKVHHMFFIGMDARGCRAQSGSVQLYADKTGWDMKGIIGPVGTNDALTDLFLTKYFDQVVQAAEQFAQGVGADLMRADFFIALPESGESKIAMNEPESVSGHPYWHERQQMASILRDGYILSKRLKMTSDKWTDIMTRAATDRTANGLDVPVF